jgi:hypothetical protein
MQGKDNGRDSLKKRTLNYNDKDLVREVIVEVEDKPYVRRFIRRDFVIVDKEFPRAIPLSLVKLVQDRLFELHV